MRAYEVLKMEMDTLQAKKMRLEARINYVHAKIQLVCPHEWVLHQLAGEGFYCKKCGAWKSED